MTDDNSEWMLNKTVEIRPDDQGDLDEIVTRGAGMIHLERMSDNHVWMAIYHPDDGNDSRVVVNFKAVVGRDGRVQPRIEMTYELD